MAQESQLTATQPAEAPEEPKLWYAIRVTFNREMKVKDDLDARGIENFIPMRYVMKVVRCRRVKKLVPSIHNLIFLHITATDMREYKKNTQMPIRYIMNPATKKPVVVPEQQMKSFIAVAGTYDEQLTYLEGGTTLKRGDRVRVMGGPFEGAEGILKKVRGSQRVVVSIEGIVAVITTDIHPSLIEKLPKKPKAKT